MRAGALRTLAQIAVEHGCGRFEWAVLDWNVPAIDFYRALGATVLPDWRIVRIVGPALASLGTGLPSDSADGAGVAPSGPSDLGRHPPR